MTEAVKTVKEAVKTTLVEDDRSRNYMMYGPVVTTKPFDRSTASQPEKPLANTSKKLLKHTCNTKL